MNKKAVEKKTLNLRWGDIVYVDLGLYESSVIGGRRPALVVQNNAGNKHSTTTIICPLTTSRKKPGLPTHMKITRDACNGLKSDSTALFEQIVTVDKSKIFRKIGHISDDYTAGINKCIERSLGLDGLEL